MSYFPMFINLEGKKVLIVGGGKVALRKGTVFLDFGAEVEVIAPHIVEEIVNNQNINCQVRVFREEDLVGRDVVVAATDSKELNSNISIICKEKNIPVNSITSKEESTFIVPSYLKCGENVAAFSSGGRSPVVTQYLKRKIEPYMVEELDVLADRISYARMVAKEQSPMLSEGEKKEIYHTIMKCWEKTNHMMTKQEILDIFSQY